MSAPLELAASFGNLAKYLARFGVSAGVAAESFRRSGGELRRLSFMAELSRTLRAVRLAHDWPSGPEAWVRIRRPRRRYPFQARRSRR